MTGVWHRTRDLVGLPGMPGRRSLLLHGAGRGWVSRKIGDGPRAPVEWREDSLPPETRQALALRRDAAGAPVLAPAGDPILDARLEILTTFESWRAEHERAVVPGLKEWATLYKDDGAGVSAETRELVPEAHWSTIQRWRIQSARGGTSALVRGRGGRTSLIDNQPAVRAEIEAQLHARSRHVTAKMIRDVVRARCPDAELPSIDAIRRWCRKWHRAHKRAMSAITDPDTHRSRKRPAFGDGEAGVDQLNEVWELDSTPADVLCADGRRHVIVGCIDVWSRRAKCLVAPTSKATAIAALLRRCLIDWGVPQVARMDEGSDYTSKHIRRVLVDLDVIPDFLPPFSPDKKPFIERFFGTLNRGLLTQLPGFVGHNVADRKAIESRRSFAERKGVDAVEMFACELTPEQLQERLDVWCDAAYGRETHSSIGISPFERAASWPGEVRQVPDERALDILLAEAAGGDGWRTVGKKGIQVDAGVYIAAELGPLVGERVHVRRDPADWGTIHVFRQPPDRPEQLVFVCRAWDPARVGVDREEIARAAKALAAKADREARAWARQTAKAIRPETAIDDVLDLAADEADSIVTFPRPRTDHHSPGLDAAAEAAEAAARAAADADPDRARAVGGREKVLAAMKAIHRDDAS